MTTPRRIRCAVYTRKSSEEGLEQSFNSLHAQREACESYIRSQRTWSYADFPANEARPFTAFVIVATTRSRSIPTRGSRGDRVHSGAP